MKKLIDNSLVSSRSWYYLLDFNERDNWKTIQEKCGTKSLSGLSYGQYKQLFIIATEQEFK